MTAADQTPSKPRGGLAALRERIRSREITLLIGGGVALLVVIILLGAVSAVLGLRAIAQGYARQQSFSAVVQTATAIDEHLLRLRIAASDYLASGRPFDRERMIQASQALISRVDAGSPALREVGFGEVVNAMRARLDLQRAVIETLGDLRDRRNETTNEFVKLGNEALTALDEIVPRAFEFGDFEGSNRALRLRELLLQAQSDVLVWLLARRKTAMDPISERWSELLAASRRLQFTLRELRDRDATALVRAKIEPQAELIPALDRTAQDESNLDRILDQENGLVQALSDQLRARAQSGAAVVTANLNETLSLARQWTILFASLAGVVGVAGAAYTLRRTVQPIRRITKTLDALASGELGTAIPFTSAPNELGQMARAADVFKTTMAEVHRSRAVFQTVLDNLPDGVMLFDKDKRWLMWNRQLAEFQRFPDDLARVGATAEEILLYQAKRGDFGPGDPHEHIARAIDRMWTPGGIRYHRWAASGRYIEFNFKPLPGGELLGYYRDLTEMKQVEDEAQQARQRLQGAIEGLASGFALYDADDRLVIWNKRFEEFTPGIAAYLKVGAKFSDILTAAADHGQFRDAIGNEEAWLRQRVEYHQQPEGHLVNELPDGRWVQLNKRRTASGDTVSVFTDITEIKRKEEEVTRATELLQDAIEGLASGFAIYDEDDRLIIWNKRYEELTPSIDGLRQPGARFDEMLRAAVAAGQVPEARGREEQWLANRLAHHHDPKERLVTRIGDGRWVHIEKQRTKANHVVSVFTDITEMKRGEEAVREAQERLNDAIESLGSGFVLCDPQSRLIAWNRRIEEMLPGIKADMKVGARFGDVVRLALQRGVLRGAELKADDWIADRRAARERNELGRVSQTTVETETGRWVQMTRQTSANGNIVAILVDITEMKNREIELDRLVVALETARDAAYKAQKDAEDANQAKSTFLATMSHEIRTPMNGVLGMLEVLEHGDLAERQRTQVKLARQSAMSLLNIIDDVLDFSKIEAGRLQLEKVDVDILGLVEGVAETMTESARRKGLALYAEVDPLLPETIIGDPTRLRQVLFNLVGNAIKFTENGSVSIVAESIARDGRSFMRMTVADTGIGMSKEQRERLFVPFEQADTTTTRRFGGTGLGLSIVARLVELMGGAITTQSAPGHGSVFTVDIPVASGAMQTTPAQTLAGLSIAVAMADGDAAKRLAGHLSRSGAAVEILSSDADSDVGANLSIACDMLIAERSVAPPLERAPPLRVLLDGWDSRPVDERSRSVVMPWRVDGIHAAIASLIGRRAPAAPVRSPSMASDRWVHDMADRDARLANGEARPSQPRNGVAKPAERRNILIVDDHPVNREVIRRQLELLGYDADEAENGSAAFAVWQKARHGIVITDCHMPVLDGFGLTAAIRAAEEGGARRTPIIALTANALAGESDRCLAAGMDDYLAKPVPLDRLRGTIERWLAPAKTAQRQEQPIQNDSDDVVLDRSVLADLFGDDDATIGRLIGTFVETTRASLLDIDQAFGGADATSISEIAHRMKGSARMVGAQRLALVAEAIEKAAKAGDIEAAKAHQRHLQTAVERTLQAAGS